LKDKKLESGGRERKEKTKQIHLDFDNEPEKQQSKVYQEI
jgi:hypothetical protein